MQSWNRKLLCSVFNAQEAREAVLGGARIIDSEDPKSALGNIKPRHIMAVSDAVLNYKRDNEVQLSTNIGEDQLLFRRSDDGHAIEKSPYEIAGKAAQAAIGVACSMGTRVHEANLVKVGLDGMDVAKFGEVLSEVVLTLNRTEQFGHCQVMSVLFVQNTDLWSERKRLNPIRRTLVELREFAPADASNPEAFNLEEYAVGTLRDPGGRVLFTERGQVSLGALIKQGALPPGRNTAHVRLTNLFPHSTYFPRIAKGPTTNRAVMKAMIDATADAGADAIMLDTSILSKVSNICLVDTSSSEMVDLNRHFKPGGDAATVRRGVLNLEDIRFFVDYCHYRGIEANCAGSIDSYQAQQLWVLVPELDQLSTRGAASGVVIDPFDSNTEGADTRQHRVIKRTLVRGLTPPEHGGVLNLAKEVLGTVQARDDVARLRDLIARERAKLNLPELKVHYVDRAGTVVDSTGSASL